MSSLQSEEVHQVAHSVGAYPTLWSSTYVEKCRNACSNGNGRFEDFGWFFIKFVKVKSA